MQVYKTDYPHCAGGVDVVVAGLLEGAEHRYEALLLRTADWKTRVPKERDVRGIPVIDMHLPTPPSRLRSVKAWLFFVGRIPATLWQVRKLLANKRVDLVHLHTLQIYHLYFVLAHLLGGPPFVITLHRAEVLAYPDIRGLRRAVWKIALRRAAAVNAVSEWLSAAARQNLPDARSVETILSGISLELPRLPDPEALRGRYELPARYCVSLGLLAAYKGHDVAIRAWAELADNAQDLALVLIGAGPLEQELRTLARELGVDSHVHFVGHLPREDALGVLRDACALVMPSRNEGQGLAVLEAGLLGVPVVCSDIGPFREMVEHEQSALTFESGEPSALADALRKLMADESLRERLRTAFAAHVHTEFSSTGMCGRYARYYAAAVEASRRREPRSPAP